MKSERSGGDATNGNVRTALPPATGSGESPPNAENGKVWAPWIPYQIKNLIRRQTNETLQPYTCKCGEKLTPLRLGWLCMECGTEQLWCYESDAEGNFPNVERTREGQ